MDFKIIDGILYLYRGPGGDVVIPDGVTEIAAIAFRNCFAVRSVTIPAGVRKIGSVAFLGCTGLESVSLPDGLEEIGSGAFKQCTCLKHIHIPESVKNIGHEAFRRCASLADDNGFVIVNGILFDYFGPEGAVEIPEGVTEISEWAFYENNGLTHVKLPAGVRKIASYSFNCCGNLVSVDLPEGLETIGDCGFYHCAKLTSLVLPDSIVDIGSLAFCGCTGLKDDNGCIIFRNTLHAWMNHDEVIRIPQGVTALAPDVFNYNETATTLIIPQSVTTIGKDALRDCKALKYLEIPESVTNLDEIWAYKDWPMLGHSPLEVLRAPGRSFEFLKHFKSAAAVGFAELVSEGRTFSPELEEPYFKYIKSQRKRLYPTAVKYPGLLYYMISRKLIPLTDVAGIMELADQAGQTELKAALMEYSHREFTPAEKTKAVEAELRGPTDTALLKKQFSTKKQPDGTLIITRYKGADTEIVFPDRIGKALVTAISGDVLEKCEHKNRITAIFIPDTVTKVGDWAFCNCTGLTSVILSSNLSAIGTAMFSDCLALKEITIPDTVTVIGSKAFRWCRSLTNMTIPQSVTSLGEDAFYGCDDLKQVTMSRHLKEAAGKAFGTGKTPKIIWN